MRLCQMFPRSRQRAGPRKDCNDDHERDPANGPMSRYLINGGLANSGHSRPLDVIVTSSSAVSTSQQYAGWAMGN